MQARLAVLLQNDYAQDTVAAVLAQRPDRLDDLVDKLQAVESLKNCPKPPHSLLPTSACIIC